jgi:hypothetical protein
VHGRGECGGEGEAGLKAEGEEGLVMEGAKVRRE